jgi:oxygen-independent coproporphyrinogen-3 oxidase
MPQSVDKDFLLKYDKPGPRYTSYPTVHHFSDSFTEKDYISEIEKSNIQGDRNISLYLHIPYCPNHCLYCGCTTEHSYDDRLVSDYISALKAEIKKTSSYIDTDRPVTMIHFGGGTPNFLSGETIMDIMEMLSSTFSLSETTEIAMECQPALVSEEQISQLYNAGINRLSFGVQDTNKDVLKKAARKPSLLSLPELMEKCRKTGFKNINLDFIYGLPGQTVDSFKETMRNAAALEPDRIVTFSYAHVPWVMEHQKELEKYTMPGPDEKIQMLINTLELMEHSGYAFIGMDHFAKKSDSLTKALEDGNLHRNFQGYTTRDKTGQVYAFGSSGISQLSSCYVQNIKTSREYIQTVKTGSLPVLRGYRLTEENIFRKYIISELMCNWQLDFEKTAGEFSITKDEVLGRLESELEEVKCFEEDDLISLELPDRIRIINRGRLIVRNIAMVFDPLLKNDKKGYSRTV